MFEKDCSHEYVEPKSERTVNATFFQLIVKVSCVEQDHVFLL